MCGIGGLIVSRSSANVLQRVCEEMQISLQHRGPDGKGIFVDAENCVGLVHTRLAILDLSDAGSQPMATEDERYTIVYNGEVYNFRELRTALERKGEKFVSDCDTELILKSYRAFGTRCVDDFRGMFAFAIWDKQKKVMFAARDPMGIKPLYYWHTSDSFAFGSEIRTVLATRLGKRLLDHSACRDFFELGSVQAPATLVEGLKQLLPGHSVVWQEGALEIDRYWYPRINVAAEDLKTHSKVSLERRPETVARDALLESVKRHFVSDVPVGLFLSGGLDSTAILALAKEIGFNDIKTFCLSFGDGPTDESELAARTAKHFGTQHHTWRISDAEAAELLPRFLESIDQPSIDGFNVFCVSHFARIHGMKVVLSGLGGDELFGSYPSFQVIPRLLAWHRRLAGKPGVGTALKLVASLSSNRQKWLRLSRFFEVEGSVAEAYETMRSTFSHGDAQRLTQSYLSSSSNPSSNCTSHANAFSAFSLPDQVSLLELTRYMVNQLLRDADVMSMANGLELRVPFVDRDLVETLWTIPAEIRLSPEKKLLVDAVPEIPSWVLNKPKRGFSMPFERWIRNIWNTKFEDIESRSPVRLGSWNAKWAILAFEKFLAANGIESTCNATAQSR